MKLKIIGVDAELTVERFEFTGNELVIDLSSIDALIPPPVPEVAAPPPVPTYEITYEKTPKMGAFTLKQYEDMGWTQKQMVAEGLLEEIRVETEAPEIPDVPEPAVAEAPEIPDVPAPEIPDVPEPAVAEAPEIPDVPAPEIPDVPEPALLDRLKDAVVIQGKYYAMTPKANGISYESFVSKHWSTDDLLKLGYIEFLEDVPAISDAWPKEVDGELVDAAGIVFDKAIHAVTKAGKPSLLKTGKFRLSRKTAASKASAPPLAPSEPEQGLIADLKAPPKPSTPEAAPEAAPEEPMDSELANLIKDWG